MKLALQSLRKIQTLNNYYTEEQRSPIFKRKDPDKVKEQVLTKKLKKQVSGRQKVKNKVQQTISDFTIT